MNGALCFTVPPLPWSLSTAAVPAIDPRPQHGHQLPQLGRELHRAAKAGAPCLPSRSATVVRWEMRSLQLACDYFASARLDRDQTSSMHHPLVSTAKHLAR